MNYKIIIMGAVFAFIFIFIDYIIKDIYKSLKRSKSMYHEQLKRKNLNFIKMLSIIIFFMFTMNYAYTHLIDMTRLWIIQIVVVISFFYVILTLIGLVGTYEYKLFEDRLLIEKVLGSANHKFCVIPLEDIVEFDKYSKVDYGHIKRKNRYTISKKNLYVIGFKKGKMKKRIIFQPTDKLIRKIKKTVRIEDSYNA